MNLSPSFERRILVTFESKTEPSETDEHNAGLIRGLRRAARLVLSDVQGREGHLKKLHRIVKNMLGRGFPLIRILQLLGAVVAAFIIASL